MNSTNGKSEDSQRPLSWICIVQSAMQQFFTSWSANLRYACTWFLPEFTILTGLRPPPRESLALPPAGHLEYPVSECSTILYRVPRVSTACGRFSSQSIIKTKPKRKTNLVSISGCLLINLKENKIAISFNVMHISVG